MMTKPLMKCFGTHGRSIVPVPLSETRSRLAGTHDKSKTNHVIRQSPLASAPSLGSLR